MAMRNVEDIVAVESSTDLFTLVKVSQHMNRQSVVTQQIRNGSFVNYPNASVTLYTMYIHVLVIVFVGWFVCLDYRCLSVAQLRASQAFIFKNFILSTIL